MKSSARSTTCLPQILISNGEVRFSPLKIGVNHLKINFCNFLFTEYAESDTFFCFTGLMSEIRDVFIKTLDESEVGLFKLNCFNGSTSN